ncbi:MAG: peptidoglycan bridge formation glycyltransferase FemA/FemB family protein [bacterium]|nr:peptidoglycan bridge formation glycyltransferase FemA/FemB family protein [bacterium]
MELFYFTAKEELDSFIKSAADTRGAEFLQSWRWGEILKAEGAKVLRVGARLTGGEILAAATIIKKPLAGGYAYWYSPRGAVFKPDLAEEKRRGIENFLYEEIKKIDSSAIFLRIEPKELEEPGKDALTTGNGLKNASGRFKIKKTLDLQPGQTLILDLADSEEELLKRLRQKTRYNISLAAKKGVEIKEGSAADFSEFWRLLNLTGARDNFRLHGAEHYRNLLAPSDFIKLFLASYNGKNIAAGLFCFWGDRATYLHGASDNEFRNVMAPYLLQWSVIKKAKEGGYRYYDFYGISDKKWPGVTRFKLGFGGRTENYPGTYDVIFHPVLYGLYEFTRKLRRLI